MSLNRRTFLGGLAGACTLQAQGCGGGAAPLDTGQADTTPGATDRSYRLHGINFSPYLGNTDPNMGATVTEQQLRERMAVVAPHVTWLRTFGATHGLERAAAVARHFGLKTMIGAWLGRSATANDRELTHAVSAAREGLADALVIGSEALLRGDLNEVQLLGYLSRTKAAAMGVPISYADTAPMLLAHPAVLQAVDFVMLNVHPYWEGVHIDSAVATLHRRHHQMAAAAGKPVNVSEAGWPSGGNAVGAALPSPENASRFFLNAASWARSLGVPYFHFEAFDESWKVAYEGAAGGRWGLWDDRLQLKPGMSRVFAGEVMADNWSGVGIPGGAGSPSIAFTFVPPQGSSQDLQGRVLHVDPATHAVAVYIYVGGWWTKPYFAQPLTPVRIDGTWTADITTGGQDAQATVIAAFLVPIGYQPPLLNGAALLPAQLDAAALAKVQVPR